MQPFTVLYRIESIMSPMDAPFVFACIAEDTDHAEEQCLAAYPDCAVMWVIQTDSHVDALNLFYSEGV